MNKKNYETPTIKVVQFRTEIGFAGSLGFTKTETTDEHILFESDDSKNERYIFDDNDIFGY